jgi:hypothetical protein
MANSAILNTPNIFLQGSQLYQNANSKIFDAITNASELYQKMQAQRDANLNALRMKQLELDQSPEAAQPILAKAMQTGVESLTPKERSTFDAIQQIQGAKVAFDPITGQTYKPYSPINLAGVGGPASAASAPAAMAPAAVPQQQPGSPVGNMLLPPRLDGGPDTLAAFNASTAGNNKPAPSPIGQADEKIISANDTTGMGETPVGKMEKYKAGLDADKQIAVNDAKTQAEQKKADFYKPKLQSILEKMANINEQLQKASALKSGSSSAVSNIKNMAAGAEIPFTGMKVGRVAEEVLNKKIASLRDQYDALRPSAMQLLKNAANIAAGSMNSDAEQKLALASFGDSNGNYEANMQALKATMASFGTKKDDAGGVDENDPRVKKALGLGYTMKQIKAHLSGK